MMKKYLFTLVTLISFAQKKDNVLTFTKVNHQENLTHQFTAYDIVHLTDQTTQFSDGSIIQLNLDQSYTFKIEENKILDHSYSCQIKTEEGIVSKTKSDFNNLAKFYLNKDIRAKNAFSMSVYNDHFSFYVQKNDKEFYIEPLSQFNKNAPNNLYIYYEVKNLIRPTDALCEIDEVKTDRPKAFSKFQQVQNSTCKKLEIAMSIDYAFIGLHGSIENAINRTLQITNLSEVNYKIANGLAYDVEFVVLEHFVMSCTGSCAFWNPTLDISPTYSFFQSNANKMFTKPYDVKVHFMPLGGAGTAVGLGSLSMCNSAGTSVVKDYTTNTNWTRCIMSHEIGHNFGCGHNTEIMNANVSGSSLWNSASITTLNNSLTNNSCISECTTNSCENKKVVLPSISSDANNNSVTYTFSPENGVNYKARMYNFSTQTWSTIVDIPNGQNSVSFNYSPVYCNDRIKIEVTPFCGTDEGSTTTLLINTNEIVNAPTLNWSTTPTTEPQCATRAKYYSVNTIDAGSSPTYVWKLNNVVVGENTYDITIPTPTNGDVLTCTLTSSATCVMNNTLTISRTLYVYAPTVLSVSIVASQNPICAGMPVTLTATGVNIESMYPYYQWKKNGQSIQDPGGTQSSGATLTIYPTEDGEVYSCTLYDGGGCHEQEEGANSNSVTISIQNPCVLSNEDFDLNNIAVFPNPTKNLIEIKSNITISNVEVFSILGQKLKTFSNEEISIQDLPIGTYILKVNTENGSIIKKVIKE